MKYLRIIICLLLVQIVLPANGQQFTVTGVVTDASDGSTLPGVTVMIKGTTQGTITDFNGLYAINATPDAVLVFSFIGMVTQEVAVENRNVVNVIMYPDVLGLDEIVVMAYGSQRRGAITGAVDVVNAKDIEQIPMANFTQILQGKAPGMQVTQSSGRPGAGSIIRIRGISSVSAGNQPLFVLDGVPVSAADFSALNPNDIESISVLKDASATSLYGSRAANGVILVTTKTGQPGVTSFALRSQVGISSRTSDRFEMMDAKEKLTYERQLGVGTGADMAPIQIQNYQTNTDWADELLGDGLTQSYELSASGGSNQTRFFLSGNLFDQEGLVYGSRYKRYSGRLNVSHRISDKLNIGVNLAAGYSTEDIVRADRNVLNPFFVAYMYNPHQAPFNDDGSYNTNFDAGLNIYDQIDNNPRYDQNLKSVASAFLEYEISPKLVLRSQIGGDFNENLEYQYNYPESLLSQLLGGGGFRRDAFFRSFTSLLTNTVRYSKDFGQRHRINALGGMEVQKNNFKWFSAQAQGFTNGMIDAMSTAPEPDGVAGNLTEWAILSYFSQLSYGFDNKYFADLSFRRDGTSRFGEENRFGNFWAVGLAWNIEREAFMQDIDFIYLMKLRMSTGTSGNFNIGNYAWRGLYGFGSYNDRATTYPATLGNPGLTWESNFSMGAGLDFAFFENRLNGTFDVYQRKTSDLLLATQLSQTSGFSSRIENIGEMLNRGIEASLGGDLFRSTDWLASLNASFSTNQNEVLKLYEGQDINVGWNNIIREGVPIFNYFMVEYAGVHPATGEPLYRDVDGNITNQYSEDHARLLTGKTPSPKYFGSIKGNLVWKDLELLLDFYYSYGNYVYNHVSYFTLSDGADAANSNKNKRLLYDQWRQPGDITDIPKQVFGSQQRLSTRYLEDASYLRLRNLTLAYRLPENLVRRSGLNNVRVYVQGQNLWTMTGFTGFDPEIGNVTLGTGAPGSVHDFQFPASRTITFGVDVNF
jgi:TonB-linked SusC/RagA family outer membrane protein